MIKKSGIALAVLLWCCGMVRPGWADDGNREGPADVPPRGALVSELREQVAEESEGGGVVVRSYEDAGGTQIREFLLRGQTFQMEIRPGNGAPAYYLVDPNGKGVFEGHSGGQGAQLLVPQWVFTRF
ncbi:MAG: DUF2782 domain-containing protein [Magnetococcales bacterium]|nr:DUF2782 domain-containing protein [Magnetococcales bacterium]